MRWRTRLPLLLLAVNLAFFTTTLLVQWRWQPDDTDDFDGRDGSWAAAVHHGSRLWAAVRQTRKDHSVWSAVAAEAAGAANEGVKTDSEAVRHLRGAFQQRANVSAIQQAQHASAQGSTQGGTSRQQVEEKQGVRASRNASDMASEPSSDSLRDGDAVDILDDELSGPIPGDGSGFRMPKPALIVFASTRPALLQQTLDVLCALEGLGRFAVYISQTGGSDEVRAVIKKATHKLRKHAQKFEHWTHKPAQHGQQSAHPSRSQHYKYGLDKAFRKRRHSHAIVLEDNMQVSPDFLLYFEAMAPLLEVDPALWCISAWNDNSRATGFRWDAQRMMRTSYFPGQSWLLRSQLWSEIGTHWPDRHWNMWMRLPDVSRDRDCIAPEVNRIKILDAAEPYQQNMTWHTETMRDWGELSYLVKRNYGAGFRQLMRQAQPVPADRLDPQQPNFLEVPPGHVYLVTYKFEEYAEIARALHISPHPRAHFQNAALLPYRGVFFLLADARACPLLPKSWRVLPSASMLSVTGQRGQACSAVCRARGQECSADDFWFLNGCKILRQHFACVLRCAMGPGPDLPGYVADERLPTFHQCLVAREAPLCTAKHQGVSRLCPCVPRSNGSVVATGTSLVGNKAAIIHPKADQLQMGLVAA